MTTPNDDPRDLVAEARRRAEGLRRALSETIVSPQQFAAEIGEATWLEELADEIERLRTRLAAADEDTKRWEWIEANAIPYNIYMTLVSGAAIDAARAAAGEHDGTP